VADQRPAARRQLQGGGNNEMKNGSFVFTIYAAGINVVLTQGDKQDLPIGFYRSWDEFFQDGPFIPKPDVRVFVRTKPN
jgi:hypothetical protein